jgi:hypothetical protein
VAVSVRRTHSCNHFSSSSPPNYWNQLKPNMSFLHQSLSRPRSTKISQMRKVGIKKTNSGMVQTTRSSLLHSTCVQGPACLFVRVRALSPGPGTQGFISADTWPHEGSNIVPVHSQAYWTSQPVRLKKYSARFVLKKGENALLREQINYSSPSVSKAMLQCLSSNVMLRTLDISKFRWILYILFGAEEVLD